MRIPALGQIMGVSMLLVADISPIAPQILQGGALAVLAWTVWHMLTRTFPAQTAALKDQRDAFLAHLAQRDDNK
jgi:threonine/homoserine/homoserine lactone efflux protein